MIYRYVVTADPADVDTGQRHDTFAEADRWRTDHMAGGCIVELKYEYSDSDLVSDDRETCVICDKKCLADDGGHNDDDDWCCEVCGTEVENK